jgi:hypothetical protein
MRRKNWLPDNAIARLMLTALDAIDAKTDIGISRSKIRMDVKVKLGRFKREDNLIYFYKLTTLN